MGYLQVSLDRFIICECASVFKIQAGSTETISVQDAEGGLCSSQCFNII